jgi:hypothetical protein
VAHFSVVQPGTGPSAFDSEACTDTLPYPTQYLPDSRPGIALAWNAKFDVLQAIDSFTRQEYDNLASSSSPTQFVKK